MLAAARESHFRRVGVLESISGARCRHFGASARAPLAGGRPEGGSLLRSALEPNSGRDLAV